MRYGLIFMAAGMVFFSCKQEKRYHDTGIVYEQGATEALEDIRQFQEMLNDWFRDPETSPLPDRYRKEFQSLEFFKPDTLYRIWARIFRTPDAVPFAMPTTTSRTSMEVVYGYAEFELDSQQIRLELYRNVSSEPESAKVDLFLPFLDETNGETTYAGGRYLDLPIPEADSILIDFNKAYNPYCVYNKKYSCPIVPRVNYIPLPIRAGEKDFKPNTPK